MTRTVDAHDSTTRLVPDEPGLGSGVPDRAPGVELLGRMQGSGYKDPPYIVRRADGQTVQLTPLLHALLEEIDGTRSLAQIAEAVGPRVNRRVDADDVAYLVEEKLRPLGVLREADGTPPSLQKKPPLLGIRWRAVVSNPDVTRRVTAPFVKLYTPPVVFAVVITFAIACGWLLFEKGLASPLREVLYDPGLLLLVFALTIVSAAFHEIGHASACRYGGATPGAMGAGLYLVWPVFYTDVTDSYRLSRGGRLRTDLGGLYFNAVFAVGMFGVWAVTGWDAILVLIPVQLVQMVHQLPPFIRLDGYHILADLTGVPDLFARIKPTLLSAIPGHKTEDSARSLKPWVRVVVTTWVVLVVPLLVFSLAMAVVALPRVAATAWDSIGLQWDTLASAWEDVDAAGVALRFLSILAILLPVLSITYLLTRVVRKATLRLARERAHSPASRFTATAVAFGLVALAAWGLWPNGQYRPIGPHERGTLLDGVAAISDAPAERARGLATRALDARATERAATRAVAVSDLQGAPALPEAARQPVTTITRPPIDVRFNPPPNRGEGHNQAIAINQQDGSSVFRLAFSIGWVADGVVDEANDAYALASCLACTTVAVAFQLVLVSNAVDVVVPQNTAVAINAACALCTTYALATQIVITVSGPISIETWVKLAEIWARLEELGDRIDEMPIEEFMAELDAIEEEIITLFVSDAEAAQATEDTAGEPAAPLEPTTSTTGVTSPTTTATTTVTTAPPDTTPTTTVPAP